MKISPRLTIQLEDLIAFVGTYRRDDVRDDGQIAEVAIKFAIFERREEVGVKNLIVAPLEGKL